MPVALNCWVVPAAIEGLAGVTAMLLRVALVTVSTVLPLTSAEGRPDAGSCRR